MKNIIKIITTLLITVIVITACKTSETKIIEVNGNNSIEQTIKNEAESKNNKTTSYAETESQTKNTKTEEKKASAITKTASTIQKTDNKVTKEPLIVKQETPRPLKTLEEEVIRLLNAEREKASRPPLTPCLKFYDQALIRANECDEHWSHTRPNGEQFYTVYADASQQGIKLIGENLGKKFKTAKSIVEALMASEAHRNNILHPKFTHICIAIVEMKPSDEHQNQTLYAMAQHFYLMEEKI